VAIPLLLSPALSLSYTADKVLSFRLLTEVLGLIGLLIGLRRPRLRPQPLTLAVAASAALMLLATLFGRNFADGFWGSYMRLFGFFTRVHGWILFLAVAAYFRTERQWRRLLNAVSFVSLVICAHALIQWRGLENRLLVSVLGPSALNWHMPNSEQYRPFATLGNPSFLGTYLVFAIAFGLGSVMALPRRRRWAGLFLLGLLTFVLLINQTRGAWLAAAAMGVTFALLVAPAQKRRWIAVGSGALALALLLFGVVCARFPHARWVTTNPICLRMAYFFERDRNSSGWYRLDMWRRVGSEVAGSPGSLLLGYGPESYLLVASRSFEPAYADGSTPAQFMDSTHDIFADALVEGGWLGLGALVAVLCLGFWTGMSGLRRLAGSYPDGARRTVLITAIVALVGYVVQGIFLFDHITTLVYLCLTLGLIAAASRSEWGTEQSDARGRAGAGARAGSPLPAPVSLSLAGAAVAFVCMGLLPVNLRAIRAQIWKRTAETMEATGQPEEAIEAMREACRLMPGERTYHVMLAASIVHASSRHAGSAEELQSVFRAAEKELRAAIGLDPGDVRSYWPLGQLYQYWEVMDRAKFAEGEALYRRAAALSPRRQWTYWEWGNLEFAEGKRAEALARYRYALALDPTVAASQRALAQLYVRLGQPEQAEPLFTHAWQRMAVTTSPALSAPERAAEHESLGLAFLAKGRSDRARLYLGGALELDPQREKAREALERLETHSG
jgi:O-antigen ligase/Tfp pilus assembly protein PilF